MVATHWRFAAVCLALCGLIGCRSGGSWSMPTFSSKSRRSNQEIASAPPAPVQSSAEPELPSAVAGQPPAAGSPYSPSSYPSTYPETPVAYDTSSLATQPAAAPVGGGYPSTAQAAAPASHLGDRYSASAEPSLPQQSSVSPQRGPYDTTYPGAASEPPVVDRYGQQPPYSAAPPTAEDVFASGGEAEAPGMQYDPAAYPGDTQQASAPAYPATYPSTYPSTQAASAGPGDEYSAASGSAIPAAPGGEEYDSSGTPYRPGGTSDYPSASLPVASEVQPAGYDEPSVPQRAAAPGPRYGGQFEAPQGSNGGRLY